MWVLFEAFLAILDGCFSIGGMVDHWRFYSSVVGGLLLGAGLGYLLGADDGATLFAAAGLVAGLVLGVISESDL